MFPFLLPFRKPQTIVQVGAYTGDDSLIAACGRFGHDLYLFEPNPKSVAELLKKANDSATVHVVPKAVSNYNGNATFKIAAYEDCSSLQDFDPSANQTWVHEWHPYKRFEMVEQVEVEVVRLDTFLEEQGIATVDLLEVDAQGEDLRVVESLGDRIADVKYIQIEVNIHDAPLYRDSFGMDEAVAFFAERQFEKHTSWKQSLNREENVVFRNQRFFPNPAVNRVNAFVEQNWRSAYCTALKAPRFLAVTGMMLRRKLLGHNGPQMQKSS
jgi:FkbM family methyltransferase